MKVAIYLNFMPRLRTCRALFTWPLNTITAWSLGTGTLSCLLLCFVHHNERSQDSSLGIATGH
jgi:hypothetical protein